MREISNIELHWPFPLHLLLVVAFASTVRIFTLLTALPNTPGIEIAESLEKHDNTGNPVSFFHHVHTALDKLRAARQIIDESGRDIRLEIDGGVKVDNIREIAEAGADTFVAGSAIFGAKSDSDPNVYDTVVKKMRDELAKAK